MNKDWQSYLSSAKPELFPIHYLLCPSMAAPRGECVTWFLRLDSSLMRRKGF
jgi:hypothetical protein